MSCHHLELWNPLWLLRGSEVSQSLWLYTCFRAPKILHKFFMWPAKSRVEFSSPLPFLCYCILAMVCLTCLKFKRKNEWLHFWHMPVADFEVDLDIQYFVLGGSSAKDFWNINILWRPYFWHQPVEAEREKRSWDMFYIQYVSWSTYFQRSSSEAMRMGLVGCSRRWLLSAKRTGSFCRLKQRSHRDTLLKPGVCLCRAGKTTGILTHKIRGSPNLIV